ncbi:hypothetical protein ACFYOI_36680 [Streptomyces microflavus]|uniref:hypothetical protein n=1 Tax=Streptomyces microflavus TaxID=1919 RepID=UPI0033B50444
MLLRSDRPLLVVGDSGVVLRRRDGTYGITPPLLSAGSQLLVPLSPQHLLISTTRSHYRHEAALTAKLAAKANTGAAHWCQEAVYRLPSMPWPARLRIPDSAPHIKAPVVLARADDGAHPATKPRHPDVQDPELRSILEQFTETITAAAGENSEPGKPAEP